MYKSKKKKLLSIFMAFVMRLWGTDIIGAFIGTATKDIINVVLYKYYNRR